MLSTARRAAVSQTEGQRFEKSALKLFNLELTFEVQTLVVGDKKAFIDWNLVGGVAEVLGLLICP